VFGASRADVISGGLRPDRLYGGAGNDVLRSQGGNDYLEGNADDDILDGGDGDDELLGGAGSDRYEFNGAFGSDVVRDQDGQGQLIVNQSALKTRRAEIAPLIERIEAAVQT